MAKCNDCIHENVCLHRANVQTDTYAYMGVKYDTEKCEHYMPADAASEVEELIYKLECLLCHATGGKLSKHTYDLRTMESAVTDYVEKCCDEAHADLQDALKTQVETNAHLSGEYLSLMKVYECQKAEIERLSAKCWELKQESLLPGFKDIADNARLQVTQEIFAEIEQLRLEFLTEKITGADLIVKLFLLKKKYTEGETDGNGINKTV